jgi:hypothetical protein
MPELNALQDTPIQFSFRSVKPVFLFFPGGIAAGGVEQRREGEALRDSREEPILGPFGVAGSFLLRNLVGLGDLLVCAALRGARVPCNAFLRPSGERFQEYAFPCWHGLKSGWDVVIVGRVVPGPPAVQSRRNHSHKWPASLSSWLQCFEVCV